MWKVDLDFKETPLLRHRPHLPFWRTIMLFKLKWKSWEENWKCYKLKWLRNEKGNSLIIKSDAINKYKNNCFNIDENSKRTRWQSAPLHKSKICRKFIFVSDFITFMYILEHIWRVNIEIAIMEYSIKEFLHNANWNLFYEILYAQ